MDIGDQSCQEIFIIQKNFEIKYIIDKSKKKLNLAKSDYPFAIIHNNHRIIDRNKIDLVVISTPTKSHYKLAEFFLKKKQIYLLKSL